MSAVGALKILSKRRDKGCCAKDDLVRNFEKVFQSGAGRCWSTV